MSALPPTDLHGRTPLSVTIAAGTPLHRFHSARRDPIFFDPSLGGRLNAPDGGYGVLYTSRGPRGAFAEAFLRSPGRRTLDPALQAAKAYAILEPTRDLTLIHFDGPGLARLGATAEVVHGGLPYDAPQAWSRALHDHPMTADGIAYTARHDPAELCYAIFERASAAIREQTRETDLDGEWFWEIAGVYDVAKAL